MRVRDGDSASQSGQVLVIACVAIVPLLLLLGLALDTGLLYVAKTRLQSAVDAAAISGAEIYEPSHQAAARTRALQFLAANTAGGPATVGTVEFPESDYGNYDRVQVTATQQVPTQVMRLIPAFATVAVTANATAVLDTYGEIPIKPKGDFGKIQLFNPSIFGPGSLYSYGDAYSPISSPDHDKQRFGYLFRIYVPSSYSHDKLRIELFDPECYNAYKSGDPGNRADAYAAEHVYEDSNGNWWNKFYRVDEFRSPEGDNTYSPSYATTTRYSLWHFRSDVVNLDPFADPTTIGDQIAAVSYGYEPPTDLKWVCPSGFEITPGSFPMDPYGDGRSFYLYVQSTRGSSENGFDIRTGPPDLNTLEEDDVNDQYQHNWEAGGTMIFARRSYPINTTSSVGSEVVSLTQVPESAAGMTLFVRHFDSDSSGAPIRYYLQNSSGSTWDLESGVLSGNGEWYASSESGPDTVHIPAKGTAAYTAMFGASGTGSAWLKAIYTTSAQDTSVWELLYVRPRLVK